MSYIDNQTAEDQTVNYVGAYATAPVLQIGELQFRFRPGVTANAIPEVAMIAGTKTFEFYNVENYGAGGTIARNANALALTTAWTVIDTDSIMFVSNDVFRCTLTGTADADPVLYEAFFWMPTATKCVMQVRISDPTKGIVIPAGNTLAVHMHRITLGDNPTANTFSGQQYKQADGWVPSIAGNFMTVTNPPAVYNSHGLNWRVNAGGFWELAGDASGCAESWKLELIFIRYPVASTTYFGTFN